MCQYLYLTAIGFDVTCKRIRLSFQTEYIMYRILMKRLYDRLKNKQLKNYLKENTMSLE